MSLLQKKAVLAVALVFWTASAHAYVDPGSSLLLIQGLLAAIGGILMFIKHPIKATKNLIKKLKTRNRA